MTPGKIISADDQYAIPQIADHWAIESVDSSDHLLNRQSRQAFRLDSVAISILGLVDGRRTLGEVSFTLSRDYATNWRQIMPDIARLLKCLEEEGAIAFGDSANIIQRRSLLDLDSAPDLATNRCNNPLDYFDGIFCINLWESSERWQRMQGRFDNLGIGQRVIRFPAVETPDNHHIGCSLSHRQIVSLATNWGLTCILVFEDDALMLDTLMAELPASLNELDTLPWNLFYLGGCLRYDTTRDIPGLDHLRHAKKLTCTHAIAYHERCYNRIIAEIPDNIPDMMPWIERHAAIDQYLTFQLNHGYLATPTLSIQPQTRRWEREELKARYY